MITAEGTGLLDASSAVDLPPQHSLDRVLIGIEMCWGVSTVVVLERGGAVLLIVHLYSALAGGVIGLTIGLTWGWIGAVIGAQLGAMCGVLITAATIGRD